jgi:hypothetical protein
MSFFMHFWFVILTLLFYFFIFSFKAVEFSKTSVTYSSLGQSVEPRGKVDNFFVACMCRKFLEDEHPRQSKKHYFYPKVGVSCSQSHFCIPFYISVYLFSDQFFYF